MPTDLEKAVFHRWQRRMQMMLEQAGDLLHLILLNNWVLPPTHSYQELGGNLQFIVRNFVILRKLTLASYSIQIFRQHWRNPSRWPDTVLGFFWKKSDIYY